MARSPGLPFLPGLTFNPNIGRTNFRIDPKFDFNEGVPCLVEKVKPNLFGPLTDKYPSFYARGECIELPSWIAFDKHTLRFDAFFQQTLEEVKDAPYVLRNVQIYFFLEDGTIQVMEKQQDNSGLAQGTMIARQRIRLPAPMDDNFYDILDFNVGREIEFFGKVFKITDCDKFTRNFLNRAGIAIPDPINTPNDPYLDNRHKETRCLLPKKPNNKIDTFGQFLKFDKKILRFYGYWDDRDSDFGEFHDLEIYYYLADDTIEIKDIIPPNGGRDTGSLLMKRSKLPKVYKGLPGPGQNAPDTILNVLGYGLAGGRYIFDSLNCGKEHVEYYKDKDLSIGGVLNCFGRKIVLTDCDGNTKEYYRVKYGVDTFVPLAKPVQALHKSNPLAERELPPWNGYGSYEDSAQNCITVEMKAPLKDFKKFLKYDRKGMDSQILRYAARMVSRNENNCQRKFIICYFLSDDTIQVFEVARENSGFGPAKCFFSRQEVLMPGQEMFTSKRPQCYKPQHLFVGAQLVINSFHFILVNADEYALRYMEIHAHLYPKSDINVIIEKLREKLKPIYKDFVGEMIPKETTALSYDTLRSKLCPIMGENFTEHEMITIARAYSSNCIEERFSRDAIRAITLTELKRLLWDDHKRLKEYFLLRDPSRCGVIPEKELYTLLRGCRIPLDVQLLEKIFKVLKRDEKGFIYYEDFLDFINRRICPTADTIPINIKSELWWATEKEPDVGKLIDWCAFNNALNLESIFKEQPPPPTLKDLQHNK
ncbi:PREDICTED: EF-hand domain-containing family member C2-like [Nicrophorus vespilloides]|uniref:EF-hand domain-containing family member C2 n=1 Tax=Nicrophorus vespilloides TaxID=110193 RepID=A0ABM1N7U4_NICVS|nr:PREDICTED: EF-hand domain-containing family member C2-like [Nicrophorus vespilloides]